MYEQTKKKIDQLLSEKIFPCANVSFIKRDTVERVCIGNAQIFPIQKKLEPTMLFDVASLTKVICTTSVILQLLEEKSIELDSPIKKYYSAMEDEHLTIRHLLTHTSGITTYIKNRDQLSKEELKRAYSHVKAGPKMGQAVSYTDTGTIVLGFMLEELFNRKLIDIFKERVLLPLGMNDSCFLPRDTQNIVPTENHPTRGVICGQTHDPKAFILAEHAGNAGLFTTLNDLEKFSRMYLNAGKIKGTSFLKEETIFKLLEDHTPNQLGDRSLGWDLKEDLRTKNKLLFHTGYTGTFMLLDIIDKEAFLFLSNRVHPKDKREDYIEKRDDLIQLYLKEKANDKDESHSF